MSARDHNLALRLGLTPAEKRAVYQLMELAKVWPKSLWLFSGSGSLHVMKCGADGQQVMTVMGRGQNAGERVDPNYIVETIKGIKNDGGDW